MKTIVREAFLAVRDGYSPDVVIADPDLNRRFLEACRSRGLADSDYSLNLQLFNLRKAGDLKGLPKSKRMLVRNQDEFRFASEIAVRYLERQHRISLDRILCDPVRAREFDQVAGRIAPGYASFQYRWAALNLRKRRKLRPELLSRVVPAQAVISRRVSELKIDQVPVQQGVYLFFDESSVLYVGETENLRKRLGKHLEHSDNKGLAQWLWAHGSSGLHVEFHVLAADTATRVRKALEAELVLSRRPVFNVAGVE